MWVVVFLAGCGRIENTTVHGTFADHRTCADANVTTILVRAEDHELARVDCNDEAFAIANTELGTALIFEALGHRGTVLYRGHAEVHGDRTRVTLRYVGGRGD